MESIKFSPEELKLLNSGKAIKLMLQQGEQINAAKVLRYVEYEKTLEQLQVELIKLQHWVIERKQRVCILFEGRDAAGKGGGNQKAHPPPQPAKLPRGSPAQTHGGGARAVVFSALY